MAVKQTRFIPQREGIGWNEIFYNLMQQCKILEADQVYSKKGTNWLE